MTINKNIVDSVVLLENQDYDEIKKLVDEAMSAGTERDVGHDYLVSLEERLSKSARETIESGWNEIDDIMDGGLGGGELGVIVAPAGIGKSWALQCIGANGLKKGKTIVHYSLELNENKAIFNTTVEGLDPVASGDFVTKSYMESNTLGLLVGDTASRPAGAATGTMYFNTSLGYPMWFNGTNWVNATGAYIIGPA